MRGNTMTAAVTKSTKPVAIVAIVSFIAGVVLIVAGGAVWGMITSQLKAENIEVSSVSEEDPGALAGKPVAGPFTAFAQANAINEHALKASGGATYAELGATVTKHKDAAKAADTTASEEIAAAVDKLDIAKLNELAAAPEVISAAQEAAAAQGQRNTVMNGSFLRASLFSSVIAYGVSALVMGLGVMFLLIGFGFQRLSAAPAAPVAAARVEPAL